MRRAKGSLYVFTFKEGMFSAVAHDLRICLEPFEVSMDGQAVRADIDLNGLAVEGPVENGVLQADRYDAGKRAEVAKAMHGDVLRTREHSKASYTGTATPSEAGYSVSGELELAGRRAPLAFEVQRDGDTYRASFELQPSTWGIAQYKALLGAIRLKDVIRVELALAEVR